MSPTETGRQLVEAVATRDFDGIASLFTAEAKLRALTPRALREDDGPEEIADRYRYWYADLASLELLEHSVSEIGDRVRVSYCVAGHDDQGTRVNEQTAYLTLAGDRIASVNLACSGWRPA